jgi:CheY-like chemotaxis protein
MEAAVKNSAELLIATEGEWAGRSLESVLERHGYAILRAEDGRDALGRALRRQPDAMILDEHLSGIGGIEVCELLREDPAFDASTPIIITASAPAPRAVRAAAFRAGAWEFCTQPLDIDTLLLQLHTFLSAKRQVKKRNGSLFDPTTGALTADGLEWWGEKLAARATRNHEALACVVLTPTLTGDEPPRLAHDHDSSTAVAQFLRLSRDSFRRSDIIGSTVDGRLALLAPQTDEQGVQGMLARLRATLNASSTQLAKDSIRIQAGYWAVPDFASEPLGAPELMQRAMRAHDHIIRSPYTRSEIGFDQLPVS